MAVLKNIIRHIINSDRSVSIDDPGVIKSFTDNPDFPYLVSFSRTGSHWLRMIMELYFGKPSLIRAFYFKDANDFTCYHTHDMDLELRRQNVIYLYRNPVETVYSQLRYYNEDPDNADRRLHWTGLYARHLAKWLVHDDFTRKKTVLTYEGMKEDMVNEFTKVCQHFKQELDKHKLEQAVEKVSKEKLKKKTQHDQQAVNLSAEYQLSRSKFSERYSKYIYKDVFTVDPKLNSWILN